MVLLANLVALAILFAGSESESLTCSIGLYGTPAISDTANLLLALPYAKGDPQGQIDAGRIFAEPAFLNPRFSQLKNSSPNRMVQLPLLWRFSGCPIILSLSTLLVRRTRVTLG